MPRHDPPVEGAPESRAKLFVLVQAKPYHRVLATSYDEQRLKREARELDEAAQQTGARLRWFIQPAAVHLS